MSLTHFDLNLLLTLDAVLSEGSVARAAVRLHVTPSAVSNALARLRTQMNDPLLVRSGRGVVPTPRSMELAPVIKRVLSEFERALRTEAFNPATTTRQFTVAVSDAGQISWLPAFGRLMAVEMPCARLRVIGIDTYLSWGGTPSPEIDAAIATVSKSPPGEHIKPLCKETSVLVAKRGHAIAGQRMNKKQVSALEHVEVQVAPGRGYHGLAELYANAGIERRVVVTVPTFVAAAALVAATDFATTLPAGLVDVFRERYDLEVIKAHAPVLTTPLYLIWHDRTHEDAAAQKFRSLIFRSYAQA